MKNENNCRIKDATIFNDVFEFLEFFNAFINSTKIDLIRFLCFCLGEVWLDLSGSDSLGFHSEINEIISYLLLVK